jgi:hypothetical protein
VLLADAKGVTWLRIRTDTPSTVGTEIDIEWTRLVGTDDGGNLKL